MTIHKADHVFGVIKPQAARWLMPRPGTGRRAIRNQRRPAGMFYRTQFDPGKARTWYRYRLVFVRLGDIVSTVERVAGIVQKRLIVKTPRHELPRVTRIVGKNPIGIKSIRRAGKQLVLRRGHTIYPHVTLHERLVTGIKGQDIRGCRRQTGRRHRIMSIISIHANAHIDLPQIVQAGGTLGTFFRNADDWQQQGSQQGDDGHHDQQLNQSESICRFKTGMHAKLDHATTIASRRLMKKRVNGDWLWQVVRQHGYLHIKSNLSGVFRPNTNKSPS